MSAPDDARCPLCAARSRPAFVARDRNRAISDEPFAYLRCDGCGVIWLRDVPRDLARFYPSDYFQRPTIDELRALGRGSERYRIELVARHVRGGRLVEIGAGDGIFAVQALDAGFEVAAIDVDAGACEHLRRTLAIEAVQTPSPELELARLAPLDAVVMWHVIEHVGAPWALLEAAAAALAPGGVVVVATPNPRAFGLRVLGARWPHVDAPRHLFLIGHGALIERGRALGLQPVQLTCDDAGGRHWNAFGWHFALRRPGIPPLLDHAAALAGRAIAAALAPIERRGLRGAAYTLVLRKR